MNRDINWPGREEYIPDPVELLDDRIERYTDEFIDEHTCMGCGRRVEYELICPFPLGDGPALCVECADITPRTSQEVHENVKKNDFVR